MILFVTEISRLDSVLSVFRMHRRAVATEPSVTCKVQVVPVDPNAPPGGGDTQKGLKTKSLSQGKLVQVTMHGKERGIGAPSSS